MSDFYSILKESIIDRGIVDSGERDAIYAQARRAMIRRLWSFEPPLDEEEIESRIAAFDVAVSDIEADVMAAFSAPADDASAAMDDDYAVEEQAPADYRDADPYAADAHDADPYVRDRHARDTYVADRHEADPYAAGYDEDREPVDRPAANSRRVPALIDPIAAGRQVRDAGLVRYYEEARRLSLQEPLYDDGHDELPDEPQAYDPAPARRAHAEVSRRRAAPEPPPDPYEDEPGYGEEPPPQLYPPRRQSRSDRWSEDSPRRDPPQRPQKQAPSGPRAADDGLPRRRQRQRPAPRQPLSDRDKIYMLLGAIGVCVLVLGGIGVYALVPRDSGVTVDIDARHEVSDAATAVRLAAEAMPIDQTFMLFDGRDPTVFETSPDNPIRFDANSGTVRISSSTGSPGVKALIGPGLATRLAGHDVRVTIVARSSREAGAAGLRFAYQSGVAISHWQTVNLGTDFQAVALTWRVPTLQTDRSGDILVIQPGIPGDGTGADVKSIKIDLLAS